MNVDAFFRQGREHTLGHAGMAAHAYANTRYLYNVTIGNNFIEAHGLAAFL